MKSKILNAEEKMFGVELVFVDYRNYQNLMEDHLTKTLKHFEKKHNESLLAQETKKAKEHQADYLSYMLEGYYEEHLNLSIQYPHNFRSSFLTQIFSFIEFELKAICKHHHSLNKTDFAMSDLGGSSDLDKAKKYLSNAAKIEFTNLNPEWSVINTIRKLRNKVVHHQGIVTTEDNDWNELDLFIHHNDFIDLVEIIPDSKPGKKKCYNIIIKNKGLNDKLIKDTENFFIKLLAELK